VKIKKTFFNTRNGRLYDNHIDINNWLFTINYIHYNKVKEINYILRDLKQDKGILEYISKKLHKKYKIAEIEIGRLAQTEYEMLKNIGTPTIINCVKTKSIHRKKLHKTKIGGRKNHKREKIRQG
jgi:hypothetical protein